MLSFVWIYSLNSSLSLIEETDIVEKASENQEITPDIRKKIDEEAQADSSISGTIIEKIRSWKKEASENLTLSSSSKSEQKIDASFEDVNDTAPQQKEAES